MLTKKNDLPSVIFFTKQNLQWWNPGSDEIQSFEFPAETVADMDVVNEESVKASFQEWLTQTQPEPKDIVIIFAQEIYFFKNFPVTTDKQGMEAIAKEYCSIVPFDNVLCKEYYFGAEMKVVAMNKGIYEVFVKVLEEQNFYIKSFFPEFLFEADFSQGFSIDIAKSVAQQFEKLVDSDLIDPKNRKEQQQKKFIKKQFAITKQVGLAIAFFVFLIGVLVVLIWNMNRQNQAVKKVTPTPVPSPVDQVEVPPADVVEAPTATESSEPSTATASGTAVELQSVRIQILNGSGVSGKADELSDALEQRGASNIDTGNAPQPNTGRTIVVVQSGLAPNIQEALISALDLVSEDYSFQESIELEEYDVVITIGVQGLTE